MQPSDFRDDLDPYLLISFNRADAARSSRESNEDLTGHGSVTLLPFTIRVYDPMWQSKQIPDLVESSRLGTIITCRGSRASVVALLQDPVVHSVEASRPIGPQARECSASLPFVKATNVHAPPLSEKGNNVIVAVIDNGIDVLHKAFQDGNTGKTRILFVWDQTDTSGTAPHPAMGYGTLYTSAQINSFISGTPFPANSQLTPYHAGTDDGAHGTHVTSIAAGQQTGNGATDFFGGVAPEAKIVVVIPNMKVSAGKPESVGYSNSHLDALRFIENVASKEKLPVVVNVSQGMNAGAHDGTSALEIGFDEFTNGGLKSGRAVVKSAGNERGYRGHAKLTVAPNTTEEFVWRSKHVGRSEDLIELWFQACDESEFRLIDPKGQSCNWVTRANTSELHTYGTGNKAAIVFQRYCDDNGDSRLTVRVFPGSSINGIEPGEWHLEVQSKAVISGGRIDAWVERLNARAVEFQGTPVDDDRTVSIPGTARTVITAAAVGSIAPHKVASFSSYGPSRDGRHKPTLAAPGIGIRAAKNGTAAGADAMSGTSMSAPHVAGAIALLFSHRESQRAADPNVKQLNAAQIEKAIAHMTQNFNGNWTPSMGYGVLDIEKFINTFG